jgi:hypothetical protein
MGLGVESTGMAQRPIPREKLLRSIFAVAGSKASSTEDECRV